MRSWQPSTAASRRWRHSQAVWRLIRHVSAQASSGTANVVSLMKSTQVASGFLRFSSMVPVRDVNLAPHEGQRHRCAPDGASPSLQGASSPHDGHAGRGRYSSAASARVPKPASPRGLLSATASCRSSSSPAGTPSTSPE